MDTKFIYGTWNKEKIFWTYHIKEDNIEVDVTSKRRSCRLHSSDSEQNGDVGFCEHKSYKAGGGEFPNSQKTLTHGKLS